MVVAKPGAGGRGMCVCVCVCVRACAHAYTCVLCLDWAGPERLRGIEVKDVPVVWGELGVPGQTSALRQTPPPRVLVGPVRLVHIHWVLQTRTAVISALESPPHARG